VIGKDINFRSVNGLAKVREERSLPDANRDGPRESRPQIRHQSPVGSSAGK